MTIVESAILLPGQVALKRGDRIVWVGRLSDPWEDVDCDEAFVSPQDYESLKMRTLPNGKQL